MPAPFYAERKNSCASYFHLYTVQEIKTQSQTNNQLLALVSFVFRDVGGFYEILAF